MVVPVLNRLLSLTLLTYKAVRRNTIAIRKHTMASRTQRLTGGGRVVGGIAIMSSSTAGTRLFQKATFSARR